MRGVSGQWGLEVIADGRDLGLDPSNILHFYIINNIHQNLPTLNFAFKDDSGTALRNIISDGAPVSVTMGVPNVKMNKAINFVTMGMPKINPGTNTVAIGINAVLNNISFMKKVVDKNYKGTTAAVLSQLASEVGLKIDADSTQDMMNWLPNSTTIAQFARHLTNHSFAGDATAMIMAVTDKGFLRFKSLENLINSSASKSFDYRGDGLDILTYAATPKSLTANSGHGYGTTSVGMKEDGSIFEANKVAMKMMSAVNSVSNVFQSAMGDLGGRLNFLSPLSGNTHEKWFQAIHQNPRIKATFAYDIEVLTDNVTDISLLDVVNFRGLDPSTGKEAVALTGKYIVTATTKMLYKQRYIEKVVLTSQSVGGV